MIFSYGGIAPQSEASRSNLKWPGNMYTTCEHVAIPLYQLIHLKKHMCCIFPLLLRVEFVIDL